MANIDEVFAAYLRAWEAGHDPDMDTWLAQNPELADELRPMLTAHIEMQCFADEVRTQSAALFERGTHFGDYEILDRIASGGMGMVLRARHRPSDREVAVKLVRTVGPIGAEERRRFASEARATARLSHRGIVPVYDVGECDGWPFYSMAFVGGGSIAEHLERLRKRPLADNVQLVAQVARAVQHAHERGILHRDLKPANILLGEGDRPLLADFGLAKQLDSASLATGERASEHLIVGTLPYMAPEQARGESHACTVATDVYGLGAVLYQLLTGRPLFAGEPAVLIAAILREEPVDPRQLDTRVDADLAAICLRSVEKEPHRRYASAAALTDDLERWLAGRPVHARHIGAATRIWRACRRHPERAILAAVAVILLVVTGLLAAVQLGQARERYGEMRGRGQEILASSVYTARHVAETVRRRLDELSAPVRLVAARPALRQLLARADTEAGVAIDDLQRLLLEIGSSYNRDAALSPYESWFVLEHQDHLIARWPNIPDSVVGFEAQHRDYARGARSRGGEVYISQVYRGRPDGLYKFGIAAAVLDGGDIVGVVAASVASGPDLGLPTLHDAHHTVALLARMEPGTAAGTDRLATAREEARYRIIVHPGYRARDRAVPVAAALAARLTGQRVGGIADYRDPMAAVHADYDGRWLAGHAAVADTALIVVVQRRHGGIEAAQQQLWRIRQRWLVAMGGAIAAFAFAAVCLLAYRQRKIRGAMLR